MTTQQTLDASAARGRRVHITLWVGQVVLAVFLLAAAAGPKLFGESTAVEIFDDIGIGQWFRYFVGVCELAGAIGLLIPALAGLAALGLGVVMVGAAFTQLFVLDDPALAVTPLLLLIVLALIARGRWPQARILTGRPGR